MAGKFKTDAQLRRYRPGGPGTLSVAAALRETLAKEPDLARKLARALIDAGLAGDIRALHEILDRVDGRVPQAITGPEGGPLLYSVVESRESSS